ncbi:hypothetical protein chiPu_0022852 [Chiloscyllium punctatum]|uniref:Uncharacterized protein n=1 Tax=Chiloscyllium punctatum TaxID=137246 RepID=A0A401T9J4_CHIPU|nr:hypothetical protein [Chiloscyllium punctatum]
MEGWGGAEVGWGGRCAELVGARGCPSRAGGLAIGCGAGRSPLRPAPPTLSLARSRLFTGPRPIPHRPRPLDAPAVRQGLRPAPRSFPIGGAGAPVAVKTRPSALADGPPECQSGPTPHLPAPLDRASAGQG